MTVARHEPTVHAQATGTEEQPLARTNLRPASDANHKRGRRFDHRLTKPTSAVSSSSRARRVTVRRHRETPFPTDEVTERLDGVASTPPTDR
jgi:hypothetical protein